MKTDYTAILTNLGRELEAAAIAGGQQIVLTEFAVGDGKALPPDPTRTKLAGEKYRAKISALSVSPDQKNQIIAVLTLPAETCCFTVREVGLFTEKGELYAIANCAAIEKPSGGISITIQFRLAVSCTEQINLNVATGDGLFLRQNNNLTDLADKSAALRHLGIVDLIYPVGVVTFFAQNKDPNLLFPGTAWKYLGENKTIRLASADANDLMTSGGADTIALTPDNLPAHSHQFSANTSSFDYGTKQTTGFDYGWKQTDTQGNHTHSLFKATYDNNGNLTIKYGAGGGSWIRNGTMSDDGAHMHNVYIGGHDHWVGIGAHSHSVSGTTASVGSGTAFSVANSFIKLMGWYRSA
ncbi:phage tail protein [Izhakiella australiensis]|uniref:phage tail protein n=1 Tax=Izhakiella australiensis TaxID=1926881 RepID=UPI00098EF967|nr:phage tail protein [Izhakiella australiensis]